MPNDSTDLQELELRIRLYEELTNKTAQAVSNWTFTKYDLFQTCSKRLARREATTRAKITWQPWDGSR